MTEVISTTPGLFPLPDWAKADLSDLKGHQKDDLISGDESSDIAAVYAEARSDIIQLQQDVGLSHVVEGQLRWDDMLAHPLCVHDSVETRGIVRYYDNNNFYREPVVVDSLDYDGDLATEIDGADGVSQIVIPGPYSLCDLATDEYYQDEIEFIDAIAEFLAGELKECPSVESLLLLEPSLVTNPPSDGMDERIRHAIDTVIRKFSGDVIVHTYWGGIPEKVYAHLMDTGVSGIGFDFVTDHDAALYLIQEYGTKRSIGMGVVDGQNTLVERPADIRERIEWICDQLPVQDFDRIVATSNTELFYLPVNRFEEKLESLAAVSQEEVLA